MTIPVDSAGGNTGRQYNGRMKKWGIIIGFVVLCGWTYWTERTVDPGPGRVAPAAPLQTAAPAGEASPFVFRDMTITPLAAFRTDGARVLGRERYWLGREARLCPVDLALGWGAMSDSRVLAKLNVYQSGRYYRWETRGSEFPVPREEIERSSANMHLIPATPEVAARIRGVRSGHVVAFSGSLVEVHAPDGWGWRSSLTRNDTGNGACELVWVRDFRIVTPTAAR